jgi:hypothetical protein
MASLSNAISSLKAEINPIPRARSAALTPRPMRNTSKVYIKRKIRIVKQTTTVVNITGGDVFKAAFSGVTVAGATLNGRVDGVSIWNVTNSSGTTNYVNVTADPTIFNSQSANDSLLGPYEDYGSNNHGASVSVNFPLSLTNVLQFTPVSANVVLTAAVAPVGTTTVPQTIVCDMIMMLEV